MSDHNEPTQSGALPSVPLQPVVRHYFEKTHRDYDVTGPDKDNEMCIEWDENRTMIWLSRADVQMILARWPNTAITGKG